MRFEKYCFGLGVPVVPVAMKVINPWPLEVCLYRPYSRVHRLSTYCGVGYRYAPLDRPSLLRCITIIVAQL